MDKKKRWTLGVVLVAAVGLFGLVEAGASPFSTQLLSDDLGNAVRGEAPQAMGTDDGSNGNNGHGNNEDGVDSSNKGQGKGGPNGGEDESCDGSGDCVDDESGGGSNSGSGSDDGSGNNGKGKGKNK